VKRKMYTLMYKKMRQAGLSKLEVRDSFCPSQEKRKVWLINKLRHRAIVYGWPS
jgi:hypothetical protein